MNNLLIVLTWGRWVGYLVVALISVIGLRFLFYFRSFFLHWPRYHQLSAITLHTIRALPSLPYLKVQITTRGSPGSTEVIRRGIQHVITLVDEAPELYGARLSIEIVTESLEQKRLLEQEFARAPLPVQVFVLPAGYETPQKTRLKARGLHYMVELRRRGVNRKAGRTFIVHFDEESVMEPDELRKLVHYIATDGKPLSEGPIYYPLEYADADLLCRAMEAQRPIGCFECREVMERGIPLHLHGSNLVIAEELENELGWDIGTLGGQPFIAEDYVFGVTAYLRYGPQIFGWHGCVMLEQPPFSFKSAFKQRYRWIVGVLQGLAMLHNNPNFHTLSPWMRQYLVWGTRYRVLTFALGAPAGTLSLLYVLYHALASFTGQDIFLLPPPVTWWLVCIGFLWLNSIIIGAWYNLTSAHQLSGVRRMRELAGVLMVAPVAGILESSAGFWAVVQWMRGKRDVSWQPTPKTRLADQNAHEVRAKGIGRIGWRAAAASVLLLAVIGGLVLLGRGGMPPATPDEIAALAHPVTARDTMQMGVVFPQWGVNAYSSTDPNWSVGLKEIHDQTQSHWIEITVDLYQSTTTSTDVSTSPTTPTPDAVADGIRKARQLGYHLFVVPLLTVGSVSGDPGGSPGKNIAAWAGSIQFPTEQLTQQWFERYWQALKPYAQAAAQAGAEQLAVGTEYEKLELAPAFLWEQLIQRVHDVFPHRLTYDINWSAVSLPTPSWLYDPLLTSIGVSAYFPLTDKPVRIAPAALSALWHAKISTQLDAFARRLKKPILLSEVGYRNSVDALYQPWVSTADAPPDPQEQAAAYNAALSNVLSDPYITGIYFWGWSVPVYKPNYLPAAQVLHQWYSKEP